MPGFLYTSTGDKIQIHDKPLGTPGAEGAVSSVLTATHKDMCVKVYNEKLRSEDKERKIKYMIDNPPTGVQKGMFSLCWPVDMVYKDSGKKKFVGFVMNKAPEGSINLYELCNKDFTPGLNLDAVWINKYSRSNLPNGLIARLKLCVNIAAGMHAIHATDRYVLVDFKPQNILITHDGQVSFIDLDSIQIHSFKVVFHAQYSSLGYAPKEGKDVDIKNTVIAPTWDLFSLGVVFYQLILGIHPYTVTAKDPPGGTTLNDHIFNELFPFGLNKNLIARVAPDHQLFDKLPGSFKSLFIKCFDLGSRNPKLRPTAFEWGNIIFKDLKKSENSFKLNPPPSTTNFKQPIKPKPALKPVVPKKSKGWLNNLLDEIFG